MESLFGCRRRIETKISVLLWYFVNNSLPPCSSRTFWKQSHWSYSTGQCVDWNWNIPFHLPRWMHIQSSFYYQQCIGTWRSRFKQETNRIFLPIDPRDKGHQDPAHIDFSVPRRAQYLHSAWERASRRGILGRYWSCDQRRIDILSNTIECNYSSRNTSSPLYFKSWKVENWRDVVWKTIFVSSTTTKDLIETRSQLD